MEAIPIFGDTGPCRRRNTSPHSFVGPGEQEFADLCHDLGIAISYEPYLYELVTVMEDDEKGRRRLRVRKGFAPDFLIYETNLWPAMHVEITGARQRSGKIHRMRRTRAQYNIHTVLLIIGTARWRRIQRDPQELRRLLLRAGRRAEVLNSFPAEEASA
jgi:hypothetical protein